MGGRGFDVEGEKKKVIDKGDSDGGREKRE